MSTSDEILDGKYRLLRKIGHGAMGAVWLGENVALGRKVAIKILHPEIAEEENHVRRFEIEARAAAAIGSAHTVEMIDLGTTEDGQRYIVMELLEGEDLAARLARVGALSLREASLVGIQILRGIERAHEAGIVHRDLKPENIFLVRRDNGEHVKILDFGVSKLGTATTSTATDLVLGTPAYMAPEQARGHVDRIGPKSDLYAVAVILYECVTAKLPFAANNVHDLLFRIALDAPTPIERWLPDVDPTFAALVRRGMAKDPQDRFASATEFLQALATWRSTSLSPDVNREDAERIAASISGERLSLDAMTVCPPSAHESVEILAAKRSAPPPSKPDSRGTVPSRVSPAIVAAPSVSVPAPQVLRSLSPLRKMLVLASFGVIVLATAAGNRSEPSAAPQAPAASVHDVVPAALLPPVASAAGAGHDAGPPSRDEAKHAKKEAAKHDKPKEAARHTPQPPPPPQIASRPTEAGYKADPYGSMPLY